MRSPPRGVTSAQSMRAHRRRAVRRDPADPLAEVEAILPRSGFRVDWIEDHAIKDDALRWPN